MYVYIMLPTLPFESTVESCFSTQCVGLSHEELNWDGTNEQQTVEQIPQDLISTQRTTGT